MQHFQTFLVLLNIWFFNTACNSFVDWYWISVNRIDGVMVSVLASSELDQGFDPRLGPTKDYKTGIFCFSSKHTALTSKSLESE